MITKLLRTCVALVMLAGCASGAGMKAPSFTATDAGNPVSLAAYDGQVLILDFWAVW